MLAPLLPAKTAIPPVAEGYLRRPRLHALWERWQRCPLVTVTAGAGYGKTSLLAACARESERPVSWLTLDPHDRDPGLFIPHLLYAIEPDLVGKAAGWDPGAPGYTAQALALAIGELHRADDGRILVLDDQHALPAAGPVPELIGRLARYLPAGVTLLLSSREPPAHPTSRLLAAGRVETLSAHDLAFDTAETREAAVRLGVADPEALAPWLARTEGWPAGVAILCQGIASRGGALPTSGSTPDAAGWFAYFAEEVLAGLPDTLRSFLVRSAALPRLEPDLCDEALCRDDSRRMLAELHARQLFTIHLEGDAPAYRYHHLFHDVLWEHLEREPAAEVRALRRRVASALQRRGRWGDALATAAAAADHAAVLRLAQRHGDTVLAAGRFEMLRGAMEAVPPSQLKNAPQALAILGRTCEALGDWSEAKRRYHAALRAATATRQRAELREAIARLLLREGRHRASGAMVKTALAESRRLPRALRGRLNTIQGIAACDAGRLDEAETALAAARRDLGPDPDPEEAVRTTYLLESNIHFRRGNLARAREAARRALRTHDRDGDAQQVCHCLGVLAHITAEGADERAARELAVTCLRRAESLEYHLMEGYAHLVLARCDALAGEPERARRHADRAAELGEDVGEVGLRGLPRMMQGTLAFAVGALHEAAAVATEVLEGARAQRDPYLEVQALQLLGRVQRETDPSSARDTWRRAERLASRVGMGLECSRLRLLQADLENDGHSHGETLRDLERAGHGFVAVQEFPEAAARLGDRASADGEAGPEVEAILERIREAAAPSPPSPGGPSTRRTTAPESSISLHINALGPLVVRCGDRELRLDEWRSARALRLFQLLLTHRFRWVPREVALETLWPGARPDRGGNNLRQTLHVLRRTLADSLGVSDPALHILHRRDALRLDPGEDAGYDVLEFEAALTAAETAWSNGRRDEAEAAVLRADALGGGEFLAESPYEEFAAVEREHLRDRQRRNLARLLDDLADAERHAELVPLARRAVALDSWSEEAHHHLVSALTALGHRAEALAAYRRYEAIMVRELDLLPSPRLRALAEGLA